LLDYNTQTCGRYCEKNKLICDVPLVNDGAGSKVCFSNAEKTSEVGSNYTDNCQTMDIISSCDIYYSKTHCRVCSSN